MSVQKDRISKLTPQQRELLLKKLKKSKQALPTGIPKREDATHFPLSAAQGRLWFFDQLAPGNAFYNITSAVEISGTFNPTLFEKSLNQVIARHQVLASYFIIEKGEPVQKIKENLQLTVPVVDLLANPKNALPIIEKEAATPFDLSHAPLIRAQLLKTAPKKHILLLTMHHIIADGWSGPIILREIGQIYSSSINGSNSELEPLKIQYADYANWQNKQLNSKRYEKQLHYWQEKLNGVQQVIELPLDKKRPAEQSFNGAHHHFSFSPELSHAIKTFCKEKGVTPFICLITAFQTLLYRYSGQEDFAVGMPIANRNKKDIEPLIGFFVNTLALRCTVAPLETFNSLLERTKQNALEAYDNQDIPFERIVETMLPNRDLSHPPFFQTMFELQGDVLDQIPFADLSLKPIPFENRTAKFDLLMMMEEGAESFSAALEYNTDLFNAHTANQMGTHFTRLVHALIAQPDEALAKINFLDKEERNTILFSWNESDKTYPQSTSLMQLFEQQVRTTPTAPALKYKNAELSYEVLNKRINQLAHWLIKNGIKKDEIVGLWMERSLEMVIAMYAIQKAGGAYLPLEPEYPPDRLQFMVEDADLSFILSQRKWQAEIPKQDGLSAVYVDEMEAELAHFSQENPALELTENNAAYMIFTSGSTGKPKGVLIEHKAIINRLFWMQDQFKIDATDTILQKTPFSFDVSVWEFFWPLITGAKLIMAQPDGHKDSSYLAQIIQQEQVTTIHFVPPMLQVFVENPAMEKCLSLKRVICSGEALGLELQNRFLQKHPAQLHNLYGPTEAAVDVTHWACRKNETLSSVPIGRTISNTHMYVLDPYLNPVPIGVPGEIYIGGIQLARSYHNRPELTAEKFIPDPWSGKEGGRLYRTGDLGRFLADGNIAYIGRIDHQIKLRGFRIELGEIETAVKQAGQLESCVVLAQPLAGGDPALVAYYVASKPLEVNSVKKELANHLPDYMIPTFFFALEAFPLTANGKIDRKSLPKPQQSDMVNKQEYVAPRNPLEHFLVEMVQDILNIERVGIYDHFFELGGNSLKAAALINRLQERVQSSLHIGMIFKAPIIADLASYAQEYFSEDVFAQTGYKKSSTSTAQKDIVDLAPQVTIEDVKTIRTLIPALKPVKEKHKNTQKNKPALFILSPPRSGSTLLRIMLAGNKHLFSPPELDVLSFNSIRERNNTFRESGLDIWLEATEKALMELNNCSLAEAVKMMEAYEQQDISAKYFYSEMQFWLNERILVDKTPSYPLDMHILKRAEEDFENARYIHLKRHPYAMIYSFIEAQLDQNFIRFEHPFSRRQLAELVWLISHQNINQFLGTIPQERKYALHFESVLANPEKEMRAICTFMGIPYENDMLEPYKGDKMTSGARENSQMVGDFKFYLHNSINSGVATRWKKKHTIDFLSEPTWEIAKSFGYEEEKKLAGRKIEDALKHINVLDRNHTLPLSFAQQRLWFIDQLEPGNPQYNIPGGIKIKGALNQQALETGLNNIIERQENLRTLFTTDEDGNARLQIKAHLKLSINIHNLRSVPTNAQQAKIEEISAAEAQKAFNLQQGPLLRATSILLSNNESIFIIVMHHIISDGWSINILFKELIDEYQAIIQNNPRAIPKPAIQYVDFAGWQRNWLTGSRLDKQRNYWKQQLANAPALLELPTDHARPATQTYNGHTKIFSINKQITAAVNSLAKQQGATLFMTLLAAFKLLLFRYSNQSDISIGSPIAGRTRLETEPLIGFFVNTLVLRSQLNGASSFTQLLKQVVETTTDAYAHQELPFEKIVEDLLPKRSLSHSPLFQVVFVLQDSVLDTVKLPGLEIAPFNLDSGTAKFDITLTLVERYGELRGQIEYNSDLFEPETITGLMNHYTHLLAEISHSPHEKIDRLKLISPQQEQMLTAPKTAIAYPQAQPLLNAFEARAKSNGTLPALMFNGRTLSYAELNKTANKWAHWLLEKNVKKGQFVGLYLERSLELVIGMYAILKAGAAYVPLDPEYPKERIDYMIKDAGVSIILSQSHLALQDYNTQVCAMDKVDISTFAETNPSMRIDVDNAAYMIYTSGSTGKPKGVVISHRAIHNRLQWMQETFKLNSSNRVAQKTPYSFDVSVWEFFWPLQTGTTLILAEPGGHKDPAYLQNFIQEHRIDTIHFVPAMLQLFMDNAKVEACTSLKRVICSGEALTTEQQNRFLNRSKAQLHNLYGPTEAAVDVTHWACVPEEKRISTPIGKAIANTDILILDSQLNPVPKGIPGELHIGGVQLAQAYYNRPELTAEKFIPHPFSHVPGARLYKTGDLVRFIDDDGNIAFLGRIDHQVKLNGLRIELGEIENAIRETDYVDDVTVVLYGKEENSKKLAAYILSTHKEKISTQQMRSALAKTLPDYMVPSYFTIMEAFPLTPSGKIDRKALPEPEVSREDLSSSYQQASGEKEKILHGIWSQLLKIDKIGVRDNFFELGGDSILSIQVIARAKQAGLQITPRQLFEHPTIEALSYVAKEAVAINAEQGNVLGPYPLTAIQSWFFKQNFENNHHWNQSTLFELDEKLDSRLLKKVTQHLLAQHDVLRSRFYKKEGLWHAEIVANVADNSFESFDYSDLSAEDFALTSTQKCNEIAASLNLKDASIFKIAYFKAANNIKDRLFIVAHHLVIDGYSWRILTEDLQTFYTKLKNEQELTTEAKTTSFKFWAEQISGIAHEAIMVKDVDYWHNILSGLSQTNTGIQNGIENSVESTRTVSFSLDEEQTRVFTQEIPNLYNTQTNENILSGLFIAFSQWSGANKLALYLEGHGREALFDNVDISRTIGWFTSLYPALLEHNFTNDTAAILKYTKEYMRSIPDSGFSYSILKYLNTLVLSEKEQGIPVLFNYLGQFNTHATDAFNIIENHTIADNALKQRRMAGIEITALIIDGVLKTRIHYSQNHYTEQQMDAFANSFKRALLQINSHGQAPEAGGYTPSDFSEAGLDQDDLDQLMDELEL